MRHTQAAYRFPYSYSCIRNVSLLEDTERSTIKNDTLEYGTTDSLSKNNKSRINTNRLRYALGVLH
jgi:hypothetical protein